MGNSKAETVAIVGAGEMGAAVGQRLRESGARAITTITGRSGSSVERVRRAGLETIASDDALVNEAGFILSIVPPGEALAVAERFRDPIARAPRKPVFVECNAISPATVRKIASLLADSRCAFIDASIIGGPPPAGRADRGPRFYASGGEAHRLNALRAYGLDIAVLEGPVGAASALKMSYAGLTKGLVALGATMLGAAARDGVGSVLRTELMRSQPELFAMLRPRIPQMFPKAYRWVAEMEQIAEFVGEPGNGSLIYSGAARLYKRIATQWAQEGDRGVLGEMASVLDKPSS
jgi:L-threonate 2-dehydrogenase